MKIFIGNLEYGIDAAELRQYFEEYGEVRRVNLPLDPATGQRRGFGFVEMWCEEDAQVAITALHGHTWHGRRITVQEAIPSRPRS